MKMTTSVPLQDIVIWQPKWSTGEVLIAKYKVGRHNRIRFTKAKTYPETYYLSGETITKYPVTDNGKIACYRVPLEELELLEEL